MVSIFDLRYHLLKDKLTPINQHQDVMLASLHPKFYHVAKSKLRERIYVYRTANI